MPKRYGKWNSIYKRVNRWAKDGVLQRIFEYLHAEQIIDLTIDALSLDSTIVKVHPDGCGALKKRTARYKQISRWMDNKDTYAGCQ